jgi:transcriptional regulator with XRE-family HTH domain
MDFKEKRLLSGLSREKCADLFRVSNKTINNWDSGNVKPCHAVFLVLDYRNGGLSIAGSKWQNFRILDDCIIENKRDFVYPHEVRMLKYI